MSIVADKVVEKVVEEVLDSVWRQIMYIFNYKTNVEELRRKVELLQAERQSVQREVKTARDSLMEIEEIVEIWLRDANNAIEAANQILRAADEKSKANGIDITVETQQEAYDRKSQEKAIEAADEKTKTGCFMGCHLDRNTRYVLSRKAKKEMLPNVTDIIARKNFSRVGYPKPVQELQLQKNYEVMESRTRALEKIVEALKDGSVNRIGLYGLGGVGKSTLLKQLTNQVKEDGLFKTVATATVTHKPDCKGIQKQLAEWLEFTLDADSPEIRATKLHSRLLMEEKILVILDDIWAENLIKLEDIGIPCGDDHKGCKVLMSYETP